MTGIVVCYTKKMNIYTTIFGVSVVVLLFMIMQTLQKIAKHLQDLRDDLNGNSEYESEE